MQKRATVRDAIEVGEATGLDIGGSAVGMTQEEIADLLGIARHEVRLIEARALQKVRVALRKRGIVGIG